MMAVDEPLQVVARVRPHTVTSRPERLMGIKVGTSTVSANQLEFDLRNHGRSGDELVAIEVPIEVGEEAFWS
jgi:hypothetical protein